MAEVPKLGALVKAFLAKFDVPELSRDEELTVRAKTRKLFEVADELHKTASQERIDNMVGIQGLAEEANNSYELGRSAANTEGLNEMKAMYERQMVANMVQTRAHWTITKKLQEILADMKKAEAERKEQKQNHFAAAADVQAIDGTEAAVHLAKMAAEARAAADAAKAAAAEAAADVAKAAAEAAAAAAAEAAAAARVLAAAARPESGLADSPSVRLRINSTQSEHKTKHKKETKMKFPKPFANKAHKPGIEEARARREKIVKMNNGTYYSETKKKPTWWY